MLDPDVDLVIVEVCQTSFPLPITNLIGSSQLAVNDYWFGQAAVDDGERLVRGLLQRPSHPAVIMAHFMKLDTNMLTGGDSQLGLMNYYVGDSRVVVSLQVV